MPGLFRPETIVGYARIAVERGMDDYPEGLTYSIPPALKDLAPGERVTVPLGKGNASAAGYVIDLSDATDLDPDRIKPIRGRDPHGAPLSPQLISLAKWISSYYCCPIGLSLGAMMPAAVKKHIGLVTKRLIDLGDPVPLGTKLPAGQRRVIDLLAGLPDADRPVEVRRLMTLAEVKTLGPIQKLRDAGWIEEVRRSSVQAAWSAMPADGRVPDRLTADQSRVIDEVGASLNEGFSAHLLAGVTGSGKTEVYLRLMERVIEAGRCAILLVPEIALTPQTGGRVIGRFPRHRVAVLHSGLTAAQRHQQWLLVQRGEADIVLGARSAVFAPVPDDRLGLIVVDEEHDDSYKQDQAPRYHGRDVAVRRAQLASCPVVLGSATPSLESWHNAAERGHYRLHRLPHRVPGLRLPKVEIVDFIEQRRLRDDRRVHLIGPALEDALGRTLDDGAQALLFLNRRGYANYIACPDQKCGWVMTCDHCDVTVVYHRRALSGSEGFVRCHHCLTEVRLPARCPSCGNRINTFGLGTQRVEEELAHKFPLLTQPGALLRMDSDTMRLASDYHDGLKRFGNGEVRVLLGTQMIAKGLDYPGVRLVGVINADTSLALPDFRATERTFQLVSQVSGRCGRGADAGRVIVQTFSPRAPSIVLAAAHDYEAFARLELGQRRECGLPPISRMVRLVVRDADHVECLSAARRLAQQLTALMEETARAVGSPPPVRLRGPAPCAIARIAGRHRQQIELFADSPGPLQQLLAAARNQGVIRPGEALAVDVDPTAVL